MAKFLWQKALAVNFDYRLNFAERIEDIYQRASNRQHTWRHQKVYSNECFFKSQFNYCPVVRKCCSRSLNNKIRRLHERCLSIVHSHKKSNFEELLEMSVLPLFTIKIKDFEQLIYLTFSRVFIL